MPFVIFRARSRERLQLPLLGRFLSITVEVEPIIVKQYNCHYGCVCKYYRGNVTEAGKKGVFSLFFGLTGRSRVPAWIFVCFMASYNTSNKLLLVSRHSLTSGLQKYLSSWHCKLREFTVIAFHCEESTHR